MNNTVHVHFLLEVEDSNPNGDANTGQPRLTDNYNKGFITDVCIKRRIREYLSNNGVPIYFRNDEFRDDQKKHMSVEYKRQKSEEGYTGTFSEFILNNYVDARAFGVAPGIAGIESAQAGMSFMRKNKTINNIVVEDIDITGIRNRKTQKIPMVIKIMTVMSQLPIVHLDHFHSLILVCIVEIFLLLRNMPIIIN